MNLKRYNRAELAVMRTVRDQLKWYLGEELGFDPDLTPESQMELELRFAQWVTTGGGGAWLLSSAMERDANAAGQVPRLARL